MRPLHAATLTATLGLLAGPGLAQETTQPAPPPPERPGASQPIRIDPQRDEVLLTIKAAVDPTETQMERIVALYTQLRKNQDGLFREMREVFRRQRGAGDRGDQQAWETIRQARRNAQEKIAGFNEHFLAECRALLSDEQLDAWDDCAAGLELTSRGRGRGRDRQRRGGPDRAAGPETGQEAPTFELPDLQGNKVSLASLRGKPVVLEFGSYTCPVFRRKVESIEKLRLAYGDAVHWVFVYTREAHPTDGRVSRANERLGIEIPQHTSFQKRLECARLCREKTDLRLQVLVDGIDDAVTKAYGGSPNRGYVIDANGRVLSKQRWIEADRVRQTLETLLGRTGGPELIIDPEPPRPGR